MVDIEKLYTSVALLNQKFELWISTTADYRLVQKEYLDRIYTEITEMKNTCFDREMDYTLFRQHLEEAKKNKNIWSDRGFQVFLVVLTLILGIFGAWIKSEARIGQRQVNGNQARVNVSSG